MNLGGGQATGVAPPATPTRVSGPQIPSRFDSLDAVARFSDSGLSIPTSPAYARIRPLFLRALDVWAKAMAPIGPDIPAEFERTGSLAGTWADNRVVERQLLPRLEQLERTLGPDHPVVANQLNELAWTFRARGAYRDAEEKLQRALDIWQRARGTSHPDVAVGLTNLAQLYHDQAEYGKAEPLLLRALSITEKARGSDHLEVAMALNSLALLYADQGAYARAEPLFLRAGAILERTLGPTDPAVATCLNNLAELYEAQGSYDRAEPLRSRAAEIRDVSLSRLAEILEPRRQAAMIVLQSEAEAIVSLQADTMRKAAPSLALTAVLRRKGRILDATLEVQTALRSHMTPAIRTQLDQLATAYSDFIESMDRRGYDEATSELRKPRSPGASVDSWAIVNKLQALQSKMLTSAARITELQTSLNAEAARFRTPSPEVTIAQIQAAVPRDTALVELFRYHRFDAQNRRQPWREERYVAYLLTSQGQPQQVALGDAASVDAGVRSVLAAMHREPGSVDAALVRLDALVYAPIRVRLPNIAHVIIAPDSQLGLVPFEALRDSQGHYALEQRLISYLSTGRDLLRVPAPTVSRSNSVIVASPDFGTPRPPPAIVFPQLAGADTEATELQKYFTGPALTGPRVTKDALRALVGPAVLHIATHALYSRGASPIQLVVSPEGTASSDDRGLNVETQGEPPHGGPRQPAKNPPFKAPAEAPSFGLWRAGLAVSGANTGASGIITAAEIAGFDWSGTQLVVLSSCETGVGTVVAGDGLYGMRRALSQAGTASQVVSLWKVNDASTLELMRAFYRALARGVGRAEALRQAKLSVLRQSQFAHPYYWAAFVQAGDWSALSKGTLRRP